jgi:hypothetical protein
MFAKGDDLDIPYQWMNSALAGLERVNPFISQLENLNAYDDDYERNTVDLSRLQHTQSTQHLIDFVFPPAVVADPLTCISNAILSPFNVFVNSFNATILHNVPGNIHRYHSSDSIEGDTEGSNEAVLADPGFLNSLEEPGNPPHELNLKIGTICRLTRNFDGEDPAAPTTY